MLGIANRLARYPLTRRLIGHARMTDRDSLHDFWRTPEPEGNVPKDYLKDEAWQSSEALLGLIELPTDARILEVGCNAGRNVAHLYRNGFTNIEAVEISPHAVTLLRETFPELAGVPIHVGAAEEVLPRFPDKSFDLVFTMAVLEHIHPKSVGVFDHIARIAKVIIAIEPSTYHISSRQFPHDIPQMFAARGFHLVNTKPMDHVPGLETYSAYSFSRP